MKNFRSRPLYEKILITLGIILLSCFAFVVIYSFFSLDIAVASNDATQVKLLLKFSDTFNPTNEQTLSSLFKTAVYKGNKEICEILISHGANINIKDKYDLTLLDLAIMYKRNDVAKLLIEKGIHLNDQNLDWTAHSGNAEIAELLIQKGLNVNAPKKHGLGVDRPCPCCPTPLYTAAYNNHSDVVQLLLEHGANINGNGKNCYTPLHAAASRRAERTVKLLLNNGANVNAIDEQGHTPLYYSTTNEDITVQQLLIAAGAVRK